MDTNRQSTPMNANCTSIMTMRAGEKSHQWCESSSNHWLENHSREFASIRG
jgi:hypothetical protein